MQLRKVRKKGDALLIKTCIRMLIKVFKVHTCTNCGVPSESVSENYRTALQRESHGHIWERPSEMQEVRQGQEVEIQEKKEIVERERERGWDMEHVEGQTRWERERDK